MTYARFKHQFTMSALARNEDVRVLLRRLRGQLADYGVPDATCATTEIALAEALNNITEHAYSNLPNGSVKVITQIGDRMIRITLSDNGAPIPGHRLPSGRLPKTNVPLEDLPEGGFGWHLIRTLTSSVTYGRENEGNLLTLDFPLGLAPPSDL